MNTTKTIVLMIGLTVLLVFIGGADYFLAEAARRTIYNNGAH